MRALLRTRRWIGFSTLVVVVIIGFGLLSAWQFSRAQERERQAVDMQASNAVVTDPFAGAFHPWETARLTGQYRADFQRAVRQRPLNGANGFWILTLLDSPEGSAWINRGWLPATGAADVPPSIPSPPEGRVSVVGVLRPFESPVSSAGLPASVIASVDRASLGVDGSLDGYLQLQSSNPAESTLIPVPLPVIDSGRNLSYAIQWIIFAAVAVVGWWVMLAREARQDASLVEKDSEGLRPQLPSSAN